MEKFIQPDDCSANFEPSELDFNSNIWNTRDKYYFPLDGTLFDISFNGTSEFNEFERSMTSNQPPILGHISQSAYSTYPSEVPPQLSSSSHGLMDTSTPSCQRQNPGSSLFKYQQDQRATSAYGDSNQPPSASPRSHSSKLLPFSEDPKPSSSRAVRHICPTCNQSFSRLSDLHRHSENIHLQIRHHCPISGCEDNRGRGYCRAEKMRGHLRKRHELIHFRG